MLRELRVRDFAIIGEASIEFGEGLNILTGETGAGKSILIEALGLVLGGRAGAEMIRSGAPGAIVEAWFDVSELGKVRQWLRDGGFDDSSGELLIRRQVADSGRNKAFINGSIAIVYQVKAAGDMLVDIHGQNDHQTLIDPASHVLVLDGFLGLDSMREKYSAKYNAFNDAVNRLNKAVAGRKEMEREIDLLTHQVNEIEEAALEPGEDAALEAEKARLVHAEKLLELAAEAVDGLDEREDCATSLAQRAGAALEKMAALDGSLDETAEVLRSAIVQLDEAVAGIRDYAASVERDPDRLSEVDDRIELIKNLKRKYGDTIEEIHIFADHARRKLETLVLDRDSVDKLRATADKLCAEAGALAADLHDRRMAGREKFSKAVEAQLADLNMDKAVIEAAITCTEDDSGGFEIDGKRVALGPAGAGDVEFMFSANPGEPPKPLVKTASGGELSRLMLALKTVITGEQPVPVMIFDEIDTGIGGVTADMLGRKLRALARSNQVFCITHLAQVARYADRHYKVEKAESDGRTSVTVRRLDKNQTVAELARMAGGTKGDVAEKAALKWAREALADARKS